MIRRVWLPVLGLGFACSISACEPLKVEVTIKPKPGAAEVADTGTQAEAAPAGYGTFVGTVTFEGTLSSKPPLVSMGDSGVRDAAVCAAETIPDESLVVNATSKGIANVIIYLAKAPTSINPDLKQVPAEPAVFDQKGCRFIPHILPLRVGQVMRVKSQDPISHNTHTFPSRNPQLNAAISPNDLVGVPYTYTKPENDPVQVVCDLHTWMKAYHFPVDHPYIAVTDADGKFRIEGLPAGKHTFKVWQERAKLLETNLVVEITADAETEPLELKYGSQKLARRPVPSERVVTLSQLRGGR